MTVSMFSGKDVFPFRQRTKVVFFNEADSQIAVAGVPAALVCQKEVFRKGVGFVPGISNALMGTSPLFHPAESLFRQVRQSRLRGPPMYIECVWVLRKLVGVDQATTGLVIGVGRQMIVHIELSLRLYGFAETADQAVNLLLG